MTSVSPRNPERWLSALLLGIARDPGAIEDVATRHPLAWRAFLSSFRHLERIGLVRVVDEQGGES